MTTSIAKETPHATDSSLRSLRRHKRGRPVATLGAAAVIVAGLAVAGVETGSAGIRHEPSSADSDKLAMFGSEAPDPFESMRDLTPVVSEAIINHEAVDPFASMGDLTPVVSEAIINHDQNRP